MRIIHQFELVSSCPSDDLGDLYAVTIETERLIKVEDIIAFADKLGAQTLYQEDIALKLAREFKVKVTLEGTHFGRVLTKVTAP